MVATPPPAAAHNRASWHGAASCVTSRPVSGGVNEQAGPEFGQLVPMPWHPPGECQVEVEDPSVRTEASDLAQGLGPGPGDSPVADALRQGGERSNPYGMTPTTMS